MRPRSPLAVALALIVLALSPAHARACGVERMPAEFTAGRVFVTPTAAADGRTLMLWVDSDGSGFLFDDVAKRYGTLTSRSGAGMQRARLPLLSAQRSIPSLTGHDETLPLLARSSVAKDPLFNALAGQLGASWLQSRVWTFDYPLSTLLWRCDGSEPPHRKGDEVALSFALGSDGKPMGGVAYPQMHVVVDGRQLVAALDTGASVAFSPAGLAAIGDGGATTRGTSFAKRALVQQWHEQHPHWRYLPETGQSAGVDAILVPSVTAGGVRFHDVWFTTRPGDDVFEGESTDLKLGSTAFARSTLTIDYQRRIAIVQSKG